MYSGKIVLVTGASGFIGTHLVEALEKQNAEVYSTVHIHPVSGIPVACDLRDAQQVERVIQSIQPEFVFHLASQALVETGERQARDTLETNVQGTINLLESLTRTSRLCGVVVASTDKVMGRQKDLPYHENSPLLGTHQVYEASKVCEDVLAQMAAHSWHLPIGITRFGNVYGGGDYNFSRLIPGVITAYLQGEQPVIRSNGQHYRDYLYVADVVDGYLRLGEFVSKQRESCPHIFNFGAGKPYRVLDVVSMIREFFPGSLPPKVLYGAKDEIEKQYVSGEKAMQLLGWYPKTNLRDGICETVNWYRGVYAQSN